MLNLFCTIADIHIKFDEVVENPNQDTLDSLQLALKDFDDSVLDMKESLVSAIREIAGEAEEDIEV